jgi:hypothetical protein
VILCNGNQGLLVLSDVIWFINGSITLTFLAEIKFYSRNQSLIVIDEHLLDEIYLANVMNAKNTVMFQYEVQKSLKFFRTIQLVAAACILILSQVTDIEH